MNYKKIIFRILLTAVLLVSFGISGSGAGTPSYPCATGDCKFTFSYSGFGSKCGPTTLTEQDVGNDPGFEYPYGLIEFTLNSACEEESPKFVGITTDNGGGPITGTVTLTFYQSDDSPIDLTGLVYRKYGPTPDNHEPHWYDFTYDGTTGAVINGNQVVLYFVDGQRGDDDLLENGVIVDQGGPGRNGIPTMNEWGMIIFMALAGFGSIYYLRRKKITG